MDKCPKCQRYRTRGITIDAIIVWENRILLIKRGIDPYKDYWALPGGHLDFEETVEDCVKREVKEETGLKVTGLKFFRVLSDPKRHPDQAVALAYIVNTLGQPKAGDDAKDCKFFDIYDLPETLAFDHKEIIREYIRKNCAAGETCHCHSTWHPIE